MWKAALVILALASPVATAKSGLTLVCQQRLDYAEILYGSPIFITSGYRDKEHNEAVGGAKHSYHLSGEAVDIRMPNSSAQLAKLVWALTLAEFGGLGVYKDHVHADTRFIETFWRG